MAGMFLSSNVINKNTLTHYHIIFFINVNYFSLEKAVKLNSSKKLLKAQNLHDMHAYELCM